MSPELVYAKLKSFDDLIRFVGMSPTPFVQYVEMNEKHVYFIQMMGYGGSRIIYYIEHDKKIVEKYVVFNRFRDQITFSNIFGSDGQSSYIPILELEKTNIFPEYPPK